MRWATGESCKENLHYKHVFGQVETCSEEIALKLIGWSFFLISTFNAYLRYIPCIERGSLVKTIRVFSVKKNYI